MRKLVVQAADRSDEGRGLDTLTDDPATRRIVISDDIGPQLAAMKQ